MENKDFSNIQNQSRITYKDKATCPLKLKISFLITFCMMGIINHLGMFLILTGSRNLSYEFNKPSFMGVYTIATFICTSLTRIINKRFFIKISHKQKISCLSFYLFFAYILIFISLFLKSKDKKGENIKTYFIISLISCFMMGTGYAFGENTMLDYIKLNPKFIEIGWIFGTGIAIVIAGALNVIARNQTEEKKSADLKFMYLMISPLSLCYIIFFINAMKLKEEFDVVQKIQPGFKQFVNEEHPIAPDSTMQDNTQTENFISEKQNEIEVHEYANDNNNEENVNEHEGNKKLFIFRICANFYIIYFVEFTVLNGLVERYMKKYTIKLNNKIFTYYESLILFCCLSEFIAKFTLRIVKHIKILEIFTTIQLINFIFWMLEYYFNIVSIYELLCVSLIVLGFIVGGSYRAYNYFMINNSQHAPKLSKETANSISTISNDVGILCSGVMVLILHTVIMKIDEHKIST